MKVVRTAAELRAALDPEDGTLGFVPTMGALHAGHLSLVGVARARCDIVVASVFVNPTQFTPHEDFSTYPRDAEEDARLLEAAGADLLFLPSVEEMYPHGATTTVSVGPLATVLEGADRPGHFDGVCTIVAKLFNLVRPEVAVFGQKDAQQVAVVRKMVSDLNLPVEIVVADTVREPDGLAMSSRNAYLSADERVRAPAIYRTMQTAAERLGARDLEVIEKEMTDELTEAGFDVRYARAVDPDTFGPPRGGDVLLVVAARIGTTRLIDNLLVER